MSWLVVGLGNPGRKYEKTRHNAGFQVAETLCNELRLSFTEKENYIIAEGEVDNTSLFILKPQTFMNLSGRAVSAFLRYREDIAAENIFVAYDDLDLPVGKLRLRKGGSGGGHKGVKSIIQELGIRDFYHVRIGIDKPPLKELVDDYVLGKFNPTEKKVINEAVENAVSCIKMCILEGRAKAMNEFNK
jgi:PTH1 family peptidyl-tRNA hydrolase